MKSVYPQRGVKAYFDEDEVSFSAAAVLAKKGWAWPPHPRVGRSPEAGREGGPAGSQDTLAKQNVAGFPEDSGGGRHFLSVHTASSGRIANGLRRPHGAV